MSPLAPERGLLPFMETAMDDVQVETKVVWVDISEQGTRTLNWWADRRWVWVDGFQVGTKLMAVFEKAVSSFGDEEEY